MRVLCTFVCLSALALASGCAHPARSPAARPRGPSDALPDHPLTPLTEAEIGRAFALTIAYFQADDALPKEPLRFPLVVLAEPPKASVLAWTPGQPLVRRAEVQVLHHPSNRTWRVQVDLAEGRVRELVQLPAGVQAALTEDEYADAERAVRAYPPWQAALRARGLDPALAYVDVWAGDDEALPASVSAQLSHGPHTRLLRALTFYRGHKPEALDARAPHNPYVRPVEGVVVTLDMNTRTAVHLVDSGARPVSSETGNANRQVPLAPLVVSQPSGADTQVRGQLVRWQKWQFHAVLHPREGLVLYDVRVQDGDTLRPVAYRLALSEIYVPYGLGDANWAWRSAFDVGEYNAGTLAQTIERGRDVPDNAQLLDAVLFSTLGPSADDPRGVVRMPGVIGLYERDAGVLWTRTDPSTGSRDTRLARELVVTWSCYIGNYIYGFDWVFKLDGSIDVRVQLTGTTLNRAAGAESEASAPKVGKDARGVLVAAPNHQHFFSFRLDLDVDGPRSHVMEMEVAPLKTAFAGSFDAVTRHIAKEGFRDAKPESVRHWHVESATRTNVFGKPTGYALDPGAPIVPYSAPDYGGLARARFAEHALWLTRHRDGELYASGDFPNQSKVEDGLPVYTRDGESLEGEDVVLWYTTGLTHIPRPEDFPVMPTETVGFRLAPRGFFTQNPALDVADRAATGAK